MTALAEKRWFDEVAPGFNKNQFRKHTETMSFGDYLERLRNRPQLAFSAYQRLYNMIVSKGVEEITQYRRTVKVYKFFDNPEIPIFGLTRTLESLVKHIKGAAGWFGTERRLLLLHGPVGSSKSTICRLLKKGIEDYSKTDHGAIYSYNWVNLGDLDIHNTSPCPMNDDPLKLLMPEQREIIVKQLNEKLEDITPDNQRDMIHPIRLVGQLNPHCKYFMSELLRKYNGDWRKVVEDHIEVKRVILSESDRLGIGTFQPKDPKNQDATELTGDINYMKLGHYGTDSDPRAFSFDGEFEIANRGILELIEILKLEKEFLYDLLGVCQERQFKPKKFPQVDVDLVLIGHSVSGKEPIVYRNNGCVHWSTLSELYEKFHGDCSGLEVLAHDFVERVTTWTPVEEITRHRWDGRLIRSYQRWGEVETTPNHALYNRNGELFLPEDCQEMMAVRDIHQKANEISKVDLLNIMPKGFLCDRQGSIALKHTKPPEEGRLRSVIQRAATSVVRVLEDRNLDGFLSFLAFYAAEGHTTSDSVVFSQKDKTILEKLQEEISLFCDAKGHIQYVEQDQCHRLVYNVFILRDLAETLCGSLSANKRLPDFVFDLNTNCLERLLKVLKQTDGCSMKFESCSEEYENESLDYKSTSAILSAQVGFMMSVIGKDYSIRSALTCTGKRGYGVRTVLGNRKNDCQKRTDSRPSKNEWVYDVGCKGLHNFACGVGLVICHNTNSPEFKKMEADETMEALRDRTVRIDIPYLLEHSNELKVLEHDYGRNSGNVKQHVAPHTLEIASLWAVLTRLFHDKDNKISLVEKAKLYDGKVLPNWTEDRVKEMREKGQKNDEGLEMGISARFVQNAISNALVSDTNGYINPFMVLNELNEKLHLLMIPDANLKELYRSCIELARKELEEILKDEVQRALVGDNTAIERLFTNYIDNVVAHCDGTKVTDAFTGDEVEPDENLMRSIEEKAEVPDQMADDFRRQIAQFIGTLSVRDKKVRWDSNPKLAKALEKKLFEDTKDTIKLSKLSSATGVVDKDLQEKIDAIKQRMIKNYGYIEESAQDVLAYVSSIFARGEVIED